jgi:16S rRNA (guanine527-N7)-methyltransferase
MSRPPSDFSLQQHRDLLFELADALDVTLDAAHTQCLGRYVELVVSWNKKLDLTAAKGARAQLEVLLADALVLARPELVPQGMRCLDVGSGAGAPALPLLIARDDLFATLLEPLRKRVAFLRTAVGSLGLVGRSQISEAKLDPLAPVCSGLPFDVALSRATFAPELWAPAAMQLATRGIVLLASQPVPPAPAGSKLVHTHDYRLPWSDAPRRIAVYTTDVHAATS